MRTLLAIAWIGLVTYGWFRLGSSTTTPPNSAQVDATACLSQAEKQKQGRPYVVAARGMVVNWRIRDRDVAAGQAPALEQSKVVDRYLACPAKPGERIIDADLRETPHPTASDTKMLSRIPLTPALARDANAGMHFEVLAGSTPFLRAPIVAVTCMIDSLLVSHVNGVGVTRG
jgi:hypothetical protein